MFTRPIFPSPVAPGWIESHFGFPPSFAPRDYSQRTSGRGQVIEHGPGPTLYVIDLASNHALISQCVRPRVARDKAGVVPRHDHDFWFPRANHVSAALAMNVLVNRSSATGPKSVSG